MNNEAFDDALHRLVRSEDGSCTAYSVEYAEHYHSTKDGALTESLQKHVIPAFSCFEDTPSLRILDICFGLGFNTLATLHYLRQHGIKKHLEIVSPELDEALVRSLGTFEYPDAFMPLLPLIHAVSRTGRYEDENVTIDVLFGDARTLLPTIERPFDIVDQDAFSPEHNPSLWTSEYFAELARLTHEKSVITTYSMALKTRLGLFENGFNVYLNKGEGYRDATVACKGELPWFEKVDMAHKIACNPDARSLNDAGLPLVNKLG
jgi:tRNA U34 5-methylaminomethyl-2-thiouridine-forming methyltransferase MnmC